MDRRAPSPTSTSSGPVTIPTPFSAYICNGEPATSSLPSPWHPTSHKRIRPIVQFGDLYRLQSPYEKKGVASLMYVTDAKEKAVFFWWKTESFCNQHLPRIPMAGLNPQKRYRITELNRIDKTPLAFEGKTFSGEYLMQNGLEIPYGHNADWGKANEWASRVLLLEVVK